MSIKIGFMQGRLSPLNNNLIQSFPWSNWENEFIDGSLNKYNVIEWTLDHNNLYENPIMKKDGRKKIKLLSKKNSIQVNSLTGDCFMQQPFWKAKGQNRKNLQDDFLNVIISCSALNLSYVVVPLVDNGSLQNKAQEEILLNFLKEKTVLFKKYNIKIIFESDFDPYKLNDFIQYLNLDVFGINYDMGNSASQGFNIADEFLAYGNRIWNVHVKDRLLGGTTVPLGDGNVNFDDVFRSLKSIDYSGNLILQTARAKKENHLFVLNKFKSIIINYASKHSLI